MKIAQIYDGIYNKADGVTSVVDAQHKWLSYLPGVQNTPVSFGETPQLINVGFAKYVRALFACRKYDYFIFHGFYKLAIVPVFLLASISATKLVIVPHGSFSATAQAKSRIRKKVFNQLLGYRVISSCSFVRYLNEAEYRDSFVKEVDHKILPNGIERPDLTICKNRFLHSDDRKLKLIFLGRIDINHKGLDRLIELVSRMCHVPNMPEFALEIIGSDNRGESDTLVKMISSFGLDERVTLRSPVFGDQKKSVFNNADGFFLLSRYEGMPIALMEAFSYGVPCFVTKETNMADLVRDFKCGYVLTDICDEEAKMVADILASPAELRRMSSACMRVAKNAFLEWDRVARMIVDQLTN